MLFHKKTIFLSLKRTFYIWLVKGIICVISGIHIARLISKQILKYKILGGGKKVNDIYKRKPQKQSSQI